MIDFRNVIPMTFQREEKMNINNVVEDWSLWISKYEGGAGVKKYCKCKPGDNAIIILAGVSKDKVHATLTGNTLTIKIDKTDDFDERTYRYILIDEFGKPLDKPIIKSATMIDGVLKIIITPSVQEEHQIEIT